MIPDPLQQYEERIAIKKMEIENQRRWHEARLSRIVHYRFEDCSHLIMILDCLDLLEKLDHVIELL